MINIIISQANLFNSGRIARGIRKEDIPTNISYRPVENALNVNFSIHTMQEPGVTILNLGDDIQYANDKKRVRIDLRRSLPEYTPKIYIPGQHFCKFPLILRPDKHRQGKHFYVVKSYDEMFSTIAKVKKEYGVVLSHGIEPIYPNMEFAVWIGRYYNGEYKSLKLQYKEETKEKTGNMLKDLIPKNFSLGNSVFKFIKGFKHKDAVRDAAKQAMSKTGLDFARIDLLFNTDIKHPYILEINPRFQINSDSTLDRFVKYLVQYYRDWNTRN